MTISILVMSPHQSDQMSQRSQVSRVAICVSKVKVLWLSEWQGHLLSCSGQLKMTQIQRCLEKKWLIQRDRIGEICWKQTCRHAWPNINYTVNIFKPPWKQGVLSWLSSSTVGALSTLSTILPRYGWKLPPVRFSYWQIKTLIQVGNSFAILLSNSIVRLHFRKWRWG